MKSLIEVNPHDASIKSIELGNVRLTAFTNESHYTLRVMYCSDGIHFSQTTVFRPKQLEHKFFTWNHGAPFVSLVDSDSGFDLSISDLDVYREVCELLSIPVSQSVVDSFHTEA